MAEIKYQTLWLVACNIVLTDDDDDDTWAGVDTVEDCETGEMSRPMVKTDTGIRRGIARHTTKHSNRSPETRDILESGQL